MLLKPNLRLLMKPGKYPKSIFILLFFSIGLVTFAKTSYNQHEITNQTISTINYLTQKYANQKDLPTNKLLIKVALEFLDKPYVRNTLEVNNNEKIIVNLSQFDCTTFAENCLAISRIIKNNGINQDVESFKMELTKIRYRNGNLQGYTSRLHYFSDWMYDNEQKKIVENISCKLGAFPYRSYVNYMSINSSKYRMLANKSNDIRLTKLIENNISRRNGYYVPKNQLIKYENKILDGDIIGITTNIPGLDMSHVVIAYHQNGQLHFIHASSKYGKVIISSETLTEYLMNHKDATGVMIARPL